MRVDGSLTENCDALLTLIGLPPASTFGISVYQTGLEAQIKSMNDDRAMMALTQLQDAT